MKITSRSRLTLDVTNEWFRNPTRPNYDRGHSFSGTPRQCAEHLAQYRRDCGGLDFASRYTHKGVEIDAFDVKLVLIDVASRRGY